MLNVEEFPAISPAKLLSTQPTYTQLKSQYARTIRLRTPLTSGDGEFSMIGTDWYDEDQYRPVFRFGELVEDQVITVVPWEDEGIGYWWAIPSVTDDPEYRPRMIMKR